MTIKKLLSIALLAFANFTCFAAGSTASIQSVNSEDASVLKALQNRVNTPERTLTPPNLDYGPLKYRLSTMQGLSMQSMQRPFIVTLNPSDGYSDKIICPPGSACLADPNQHQWQVALLNSYYGTLFCGGSHIGGGWIVTAAHCIVDQFGQPLKKSDITILTKTSNLTLGGSKFPLIQDPIYHEKWNPTTKENDIALIRVAGIIDASSLKIADYLTDINSTKPQSLLRVSGWGLTSESGAISTKLLAVDVPVVSLQKCNESYPKFITEKQICAGSKGRDSCQGDSGGPLVTRTSGEAVLVGVVSWGEGCGRDGYPGVYTRTFAYREWIKSHSGI